MLIRFRIDGKLYLKHEIPNNMVSPVIARIKIISGLDITKSKIPQDGRVSVVIKDSEIDLRTSTFPSMYGENVVLRLLDKSKGPPRMTELGFCEADLVKFRSMLRSTKGLVLVSGPTGSGKTTTLYSAISYLNTQDKNIMTVEDPIEYEMDGLIQSQINTAFGATFATALRAILRQDPDIIYVGEIRDLETAEIAIQSAMTGHLVLSTIHANDSIGILTRLNDLGIQPDLLASVLNGGIAQRLVRKNCSNCAMEYVPDEQLLKKLNLPENSKFMKGKGCNNCSNIGFKGRIGLYEVLHVNAEIKRLISKKTSEGEILAAAKANGMRSILDDGLAKALNGITSLEEVVDVAMEGEE